MIGWSARTRLIILRAAAVAVVAFAAVALWKQWQSASRQQLTFSIDFRWLLASSILFLSTYLVLIEMWRRVLAVYGSRISFIDAAHVWFVSNLGKYVPGKIWQVTASTAMMTRLGARAVDAGSAAGVIAVVNVLAGFAIVLAAGFGLLRALGPVYARATIVGTAFLVVALLAAPWTVGIINRVVSRVLRRPVTLALPGKAMWISLVGCSIAWCVYGAAFQLLVRSLIGHAEGRWTAYLAAYTLSYLVGYIALFAPGGVGVREARADRVPPCAQPRNARRGRADHRGLAPVADAARGRSRFVVPAAPPHARGRRIP